MSLKAVIRKQQTYPSQLIGGTPKGIWYADLYCCGVNRRRVQYWSFGAVLGSTLEHFRREHRD